jgi:di/tricarboxylate transporter
MRSGFWFATDPLMTGEHITIFVLLGALVVLLVWGRWRYDVVAFGALIAAVLSGLVPAREAFAGFGHPATVTVALVLVLSRALADSGATEFLARSVMPFVRRPSGHIGILAGIGALLSGFMNNVGTLALLMPIALQTAAKTARSAAALLMPLSFGTILGGMITLIGTPPNIIVASIRAQSAGEPFGMFDYAPVGGITALAGLIFVALLGWRLVPQRDQRGAAAELFDIEPYLAELIVPEESALDGKTVADLHDLAGDIEVQVVTRLRHGLRRSPVWRTDGILAGDHLLVQIGPDELEKLAGRLEVKLGEADDSKTGLLTSDDAEVIEALVPRHSGAEGRTAEQLRFISRFGVNLLGVSRRGRPYRGRLGAFSFREGDVLLLHGEAEKLAGTLSALGLLPLADRGLSFGLRSKGPALIALFAGAVALASTGILPIYIALGLALVAMVVANLLTLRSLYEGVDWSVIVLLGALIPVGGALQTTGATELIAEGILQVASGWSPVVVLGTILIVTMTLSDLVNNAATAIVMGPIAVTIAARLGSNPDAFLMAVAVGASCAFLTPIGHQNNALIMGPAGYRFGDYWRLGLPLEILIVAVALPAIVLFWGI